MKSETALALASPLSPRRQSCYSNASAASDAARRRLLSVKGDPFLLADWERALFMHFVLAPEVLRPYVPEPFELELHEGRACVSVVALTMRRFRACRRAALAWLLRPVAQQRFLNVRTYVRWRDEPGALFLWGWLSKPFRVGLPGAMFGLPYAFASLDYDHQLESGLLRGVARVEACSHRFAYRAAIDRKTAFQPCPAGSLAEFAMERYTGFFCRGGPRRVFRAWHPPWLQAAIELEFEEDSLLRARFPWFKEARLAASNFAPGFERVWLGRAHRLERAARAVRPRRSVLSAFYEMP